MATRTTKHLDGVAAPGLSSKEVLSLILREINKDADVVPPGFMSSHAYAREWKMSIRRAQEILKEATERGIMERRDLRVLSGSKRVVCPYYCLVQKG